MEQNSPEKNPLNSNSSRKKRRTTLLLIYFLFLFVFFITGAEILLRLKGFKPYKPAELSVKIEPDGKLFCLDEEVGYAQLPGKFLVTLSNGYTFALTHLTNGLRATRADGLVSRGKPAIWVMGCSFTHGWSLPDNQTYPWLLQEKLPDYDVLNFGVNGYGVVQSYFQFKKFMRELPKPRIVVFNYAYFHDERNTFLRSWKKSIVPYNKLGPISPPYARFDKNGCLVFHRNPATYQEFPLQRQLALSHFIEQLYNRLEDRWVRSHAVSKATLELFASECKTNGIEFVVAGITRGNITKDVLNFCSSKNIKTVDISVSLSDPKNRNLPYDDHPGFPAQQHYAETLCNFLKGNILNK